MNWRTKLTLLICSNRSNNKNKSHLYCNNLRLLISRRSNRLSKMRTDSLSFLVHRCLKSRNCHYPLTIRIALCVSGPTIIFRRMGSPAESLSTTTLSCSTIRLVTRWASSQVDAEEASPKTRMSASFSLFAALTPML